MGIFSRKSAESKQDQTEIDAVEIDETELDESEGVDESAEAEGVDEPAEAEPDSDEQSDGADEDAAPSGRLPRPHDLDRSNGPYDNSELDDLGERMDLGALALVPVAGSELRLDVDADGRNVTGVTMVSGDSAVQVQAFAAPKSSGLWDAIRDEIADNLIEAGGTAEEVLGDLGIELHARMPARGSDGRTTYSPVRFLGVDGPRWFLRAVLSGRAAIDDEAAAQGTAFVRDLVVTRGREARAPRELLELTIPQDLLDQGEAVQPDDASGDDLKPFERGPEITEVR